MQCLYKKRATKSCILNTEADIIHIATHGCFLETDEGNESYDNVLFKSAVFFSGVNDWLSGVDIDDNGIVTASDLYYSKLNCPELIVLSSCMSGYGEINLMDGIIGLRTVLKALGTKHIILSLWEIDDFATAIFMDKLYDNLIYNEAGRALSDAQIYLKNVTIMELKNSGWFDPVILENCGVAVSTINEYVNRENTCKPFSNIKYWGGYIVIE